MPPLTFRVSTLRRGDSRRIPESVLAHCEKLVFGDNPKNIRCCHLSDLYNLVIKTPAENLECLTVNVYYLMVLLLTHLKYLHDLDLTD